jgi:hypothetical protein
MASTSSVEHLKSNHRFHKYHASSSLSNLSQVADQMADSANQTPGTTRNAAISAIQFLIPVPFAIDMQSPRMPTLGCKILPPTEQFGR